MKRRREVQRRAALAVVIGLVGAVLVPIACGVDRPPPLQHPEFASTGSGTGGEGGNGGAGGVGGPIEPATGSGGPSNLCECAAEAFALGSPCNDCFHQIGDCAVQAMACDQDPDCIDLLVALAGCDAGATCLASTLATHPGRGPYLDVLACACNVCGPVCIPKQSVPCAASKPDGGADAEADAEAGVGAEAGADPDAGADVDAGTDAGTDADMDADPDADAADASG